MYKKNPINNENPFIVSKFGGSSMADATAIARSARIVEKRNSSIVVVSATYGTTDLLVEMIKTAENGTWKEVEPLINKIRTSHHAIADEMNVSDSCRQSLDELLNIMHSLADEICRHDAESTKLKEALLGMGERMSSLLITEYLNQSGKKAICFDAATVIRTDDQFTRAVPQFEKIETLCKEHLHPLFTADENTIVITQGFIGSTAEKIRTTLGRGGSDYSAAILAWAMDADTLEIWTDVGGIATTDPRVVPQARSIPEISFQEAAELATFGAKILHPSTLVPAMWKNIPVFVGSSIHPDEGGTWIYRQVEEAPLVRAMAIRRKQALLTLTTTQMLHTYGFLYRVFKIFHDHRVSVDSITTSEISVALTVDDVTLQNRALIEDLEGLGQLIVEESYELISLIGNNINHTSGLARNIFKSLEDINVRVICQGASRHNFCFLVGKDHGEDALRRLHKTFIE